MQDTKATDTTYERIDVTTETRQIITVLDVSHVSATVSIETIRADGRPVEDTIGPVPLTQVPPSVLGAILGG
jgi:hypothetical protein